LEIHRHPEGVSSPHATYQSRSVAQPSDVVSPLAASERSLVVADLLP
jgi:hypothetical protein